MVTNDAHTRDVRRIALRNFMRANPYKDLSGETSAGLNHVEALKRLLKLHSERGELDSPDAVY